MQMLKSEWDEPLIYLPGDARSIHYEAMYHRQRGTVQQRLLLITINIEFQVYEIHVLLIYQCSHGAMINMQAMGQMQQ